MNATTMMTAALGLVFAVACSKAGEESSAPAQTTAAGQASENSTDKTTGQAADNATGGGGAAAPAPAGVPMPATLRAYREAFLPIWQSQPQSGRSKLACDQFSTLQKRAEAIEKQAPAGVDASTWERARESLTLCNESISEVCDDEDIASEDMAAEHLECIHKAVTELSGLFAGDPGAGTMEKKN